MTLLTSLLNSLAAKVKNIPAGDVTATTVQSAINELDTKKAAITYVDSSIASAIVGVFSFRGTHDASSNLFPTTGGSGTSGAVRKADVWKVSVAGSLGGVAVNANDTLYALVNSPGQTAGNWDIVESNIGYTPENAANKDTSGGYVGLTSFKINFKNIANTFTSFFTNSNTAARTYTFQDRNGTIADDTDLALKAPLNAPTFTGNAVMFSGLLRLQTPNVETLSANKILTVFSGQIVSLDPNGANRDVSLWASPTVGDQVKIVNTSSGAFILTVKTSAGVAVTGGNVASQTGVVFTYYSAGWGIY